MPSARLGLARHLAPSPAVIIFASRGHRPAHNPATTLAVTITASPGPRIASACAPCRQREHHRRSPTRSARFYALTANDAFVLISSDATPRP